MKPEWWHPRIFGITVTVIAFSWLVAIAPLWMDRSVAATGIALIVMQVAETVVQFDWVAP